jgi:uncharacterized protein YndB with AHSA1/START domain
MEATVIPGTIERDIVIEAPVEAVWRAVTQPGQISRWFTDSAQIDLRPNGTGTLVWDGRATSQPATVHLRIVTIEPPRTFSFRWLHPAGAAAGENNSLLVEFTLTPEGGHTRLRLTESGLSQIHWPKEQKAAYAAQNSKGWDIHIAHLRDYAEWQQEGQ